MKNIYKILILASYTSLFAQSPIINIAETRDVYNIEGAYYKDVDSVLNDFEGTWVMTTNNNDGTTSYLKIRLRKVALQYNAFRKSYSDELVGVYQYIDHGVEKVNTLSHFNDAILPWKFDIHGNNILFFNSKPDCPDCSLTEKRVSLSYYEEDRNYIGSSMLLRRMVSTSGQPMIKLRVMQYNNILVIDGEPPHQFSNMIVPFGVYDLIKEP